MSLKDLSLEPQVLHWWLINVISTLYMLSFYNRACNKKKSTNSVWVPPVWKAIYVGFRDFQPLSVVFSELKISKNLRTGEGNCSFFSLWLPWSIVRTSWCSQVRKFVFLKLVLYSIVKYIFFYWNEKDWPKKRK